MRVAKFSFDKGRGELLTISRQHLTLKEALTGYGLTEQMVDVPYVIHHKRLGFYITRIKTSPKIKATDMAAAN